MQCQDPIHDITFLDKSILVATDKFVSKHSNPVIQNFGDQLIGASQKTNRSNFLDFFGPVNFRNQGNSPIIQSLYIQRPFMKGLKQVHNIIFNNIPIESIELCWNIIGSRRSIGVQREKGFLTSSSLKGLVRNSLKEICPRGNNKDIIYFLISW